MDPRKMQQMGYRACVSRRVNAAGEMTEVWFWMRGPR